MWFYESIVIHGQIEYIMTKRTFLVVEETKNAGGFPKDWNPIASKTELDAKQYAASNRQHDNSKLLVAEKVEHRVQVLAVKHGDAEWLDVSMNHHTPDRFIEGDDEYNNDVGLFIALKRAHAYNTSTDYTAALDACEESSSNAEERTR